MRKTRSVMPETFVFFACGQYYSLFLYCRYGSCIRWESDVDESNVLIPLCFNTILLNCSSLIVRLHYRSGFGNLFLIASYNSAYELSCGMENTLRVSPTCTWTCMAAIVQMCNTNRKHAHMKRVFSGVISFCIIKRSIGTLFVYS